MTSIVMDNPLVEHQHRAAPLPRQCRELMADAYRVLGRAMSSPETADAFADSHLAALRGAAAVLATRTRPRRMARASAWDLLARVAPEFAEWAVYFASASSRRHAIVAGMQVTVSQRDVDDMVRATGQFLELVEGTLKSQPGR